MVMKLEMGAVALMLALGLSACGPQAATPERAEASTPSSQTSSRYDAPDPRDTDIPLVDGKPMWSANREHTAEENARLAFERNGEAFGAKSIDAFVAKAHAFTDNPPAGVQKIKRANGDTLLYDPKGNVFAVVTKDGAPRTMFKPDDGPAYWQEQKDKESARAMAKSKSREG